MARALGKAPPPERRISPAERPACRAEAAVLGKGRRTQRHYLSEHGPGRSLKQYLQVRGCGEGVKQMGSCGPVKLRIRDNIASRVPIAWRQLGHISLGMCFGEVFQTRTFYSSYAASPVSCQGLRQSPALHGAQRTSRRCHLALSSLTTALRAFHLPPGAFLLTQSHVTPPGTHA